jgi:hypothetical protein
MNAAKFIIEEWAFEMDAQTSRAERIVFFERVCRFGDFTRGVKHRFPRRRHHRCDESGRSHARVFGGCNRHGITLIAIEEKLAGTIGVDVDQSRRYRRADRKRTVAGTLSGQYLGDASVLDGDSSEGGCAVTDGDEYRA